MVLKNLLFSIVKCATVFEVFEQCILQIIQLAITRFDLIKFLIDSACKKEDKVALCVVNLVRINQNRTDIGQGSLKIKMEL